MDFPSAAGSKIVRKWNTSTITPLSNRASQEKSFIWKVPNFAAVRHSDTRLKAQQLTFKMGGEIGFPISWKLYLAPTLQKQEGPRFSKWIGIFGRIVEYAQNVDQLAISVRLHILPNEIFYTNPRSYYTFNESYHVNTADMDEGPDCKFPAFIPQDSMEVPLAEDGSLDILVTVKMATLENVACELKSVEMDYKLRFADKLQQDLASIRENTLDIPNKPTRIVSMDGKEFPVNRILLAARSPMFRAMFQTSMTESESGVVKVDEMTAEPLEIILEFCKSGTLKEKWSEVGVIEGVVYGAHKYMLEDLQQFLEKVLVLVVKPENCGELLSLARTFEMTTAEKQLFEYFKRNLANNLEQVFSFVDNLREPGKENEQDNGASSKNGERECKRMKKD